jgi:hypothetical protein
VKLGYLRRALTLASLDSGLDNLRMVGVGDERNDEVVLGNLSLQCVRVADIERDGGRAARRKAGGELFRGREGTTS